MTAPLRFALVPVEPADSMKHAFWNTEDYGISTSYAAMLAASPGNDLLERIVTELNSAHALALNTGYRQSADRIHALLNELGGGHG